MRGTIVRFFRDLFFRLFQKLDNRTNRVLFYFTLAYLLLMVTPVIVFASSLSGTAAMLKAQYEASALSMVESAALQAEGALSLIARFDADTLPGSPALNKRLLAIAGGARFDALDVRQAFESLPVLADSSGLVRGYRLYLRGGDFVLEPGLGYQKPARLYKSMLRFGDMTYEDWRGEICLNLGPATVYSAARCYLGGETSCILVSYPYSAATSRVVGRTLYYVDASRLCALFDGLFENGSSRLMVFDGQGRLLTSRGTLQDGDEALFSLLTPGASSLARHGELASYYKSANGWSYVVLTSRALFTRRALRSLLPMTLFLSAVLLATITLGVAFLREQRKPLNRIFALLPEEPHGSTGGLDDVERSLQALQDDREDLAEQCRLKTHQMRDACLNQLLSGSLFGSKSFGEMMQATGIHVPAGRLRAAYMFLSGHSYSDETLSVSVISECLAQCGEAVRLLTPVAPKRYVLVIPGDGDDSFEQSAACRLLSQLHTAVANQFAMNCVFYVGVEVATLDDFHLSLESARNIMCVGSDQEQFLFVAERTAPVGYDYTDRQEETLRQLVTGGCKDEVCQLMGKIYTRNFSTLSLDSHQTRLLQARLCNSLMHCAADFRYRLPAGFLNGYAAMEPHEFFQQAERHLIILCDLALKKHADDSRRTVDRMVEYLSAHYCLPDMSLSHLSIQFGLTEPYISKVLHDRLGKTFAAWLEEKRIFHARDLLDQDPSLSFDELAVRVGYTSTRTFQRAFSRVLSCSPASYRRAQGKKGGTIERRPF